MGQEVTNVRQGIWGSGLNNSTTDEMCVMSNERCSAFGFRRKKAVGPQIMSSFPMVDCEPDFFFIQNYLFG